jgi:hypothetical protein
MTNDRPGRDVPGARIRPMDGADQPSSAVALIARLASGPCAFPFAAVGDRHPHAAEGWEIEQRRLAAEAEGSEAP